LSLRAFHITFIIISTLLTVGFAAWCFSNASSGNPYALMGKGSSVMSAALAIYLVWFVRKTKGLGGSE
jgi:hypothetical protein